MLHSGVDEFQCPVSEQVAVKLDEVRLYPELQKKETVVP